MLINFSYGYSFDKDLILTFHLIPSIYSRSSSVISLLTQPATRK